MRTLSDHLKLTLALAASALCLLASLPSGSKSARFADGARETHGTIVRTWQDDASSTQESRTRNWVEVRFDAAGERYVARQTFGDSLWTTLSAGMEMPVTYLEANPATNFIGTRGPNSAASLALTMAFAFLAIAALQVWRSLAVPPTRSLSNALNDATDSDVVAIFARRPG